MQIGRGLSPAKWFSLSCLIVMAACSSTVAGSRAELIRVNVPVAQAEQLVSEAENLTLAIVTADRDRIDPEQPGFKGPTPSGECRVYMNRRTPVSSDNLFASRQSRRAGRGDRRDYEDPRKDSNGQHLG